jgi:predicted transcriptional regulator
MPPDSKKDSSKKLLDKYHIEHIQRGVEAARRGEFATEAEVKAFFDKYSEPSRKSSGCVLR